MPTSARLPRPAAAALALLGLMALCGCGGGSSAGSGGTGGSSSGGGGSSSGGSSGTTTGSASLSWTAPTTNSDGSPLADLSGYHIHYGSSADLLTSQIDVDSSTTSYMVNNLIAGTWYFAVTAVNSIGLESDLSNTASKTIN
jgi:hypothetical protein